MKVRILMSACLVAGLFAGWAQASGTASHSVATDVKLSPDLLNLLRAEMREVSAGVQAIAVAIATADWESVQRAGSSIRASYVMERNLTPAQAAELGTVLAERFKRLDADFHHRAARVAAAAAVGDAELVLFQYSRLLESCVLCHSEFARARFPEFTSAAHPQHHH